MACGNAGLQADCVEQIKQADGALDFGSISITLLVFPHHLRPLVRMDDPI